MTEGGNTLLQMAECLEALGTEAAKWGGEQPVPRWAPRCAVVVWDGTTPSDPEEVRRLLRQMADDLVIIADLIPGGEQSG